MYIKLGQEDYDAIAELIAEEDVSDGEVYYQDIVEISFSKYVRAELDYDDYTGTGTWEVKSVDFSLENVTCGNIEIRYSHERLEKTIEEMLWRI